ncbi:hypothetical protein QN277_007458 [Acacia crassicarpa]|uniref:F-box domain-containing protein n=1 Tax=Acacia crassicarpa TaxID=499986 RepID=A0AAE1MFE4_9FABA|nr:hypothetical protein QN277_007458 [Acacia crassicarpa]
MGAAISLQFILATGIWIFPVEVAWMEALKQEELRIDKRSFDLIPKDIFDVPIDFLELLFDHLSFTDQLQFARCCKYLYSLAIRRPYPKARETPWLIGLTEDPPSCERIYNQVTCYQIGAKSFEHSHLHIIGSFKGWLCVHYGYNLTQLINILSNVHYDLPPLSTVKNFVPSEIKHIRAFGASFCRFMRPNMIAIVSGLGNLGLFKIGGSKWKCHIRKEKYVNLTFYKVKMYAVRKEFNQVDIFEIDDNLELSLVGAIDCSEVIRNSLPPPFQAYLVVDSKDNLFLVLQHRKMFGSVLMAIEFEIFKTRDGKHLVKVDTLDDQIVLLSDTCSEIIDFKDCLPSTFFEGNQICFTTGEFDHDFGIYSCNDETIRWLMPFREMYCLHWMFPRFASQCTCESHPAC